MNTELRQILRANGEKYPQMEPQDAVKLVYQNEFGGGHLISDPDASYSRLSEEASKSSGAPSEEFEPIGNGIVRVNLGGDYPLDLLNRDFIRSAAAVSGDLSSFEEKLTDLRAVTEEGCFAFSLEALDRYLEAYRNAGYPMVSHSDPYRTAYQPSYRIVLRRFSLPLFLQEVQERSRRSENLIVAVDGRCASGKSTFADELHRRFGWSVIHMDDFFLRPEQRTPERYAAPGENVDHERFLEEVLLPLRDGTLSSYRPFDCSVMEIAEPVSFEKTPVTIVEGSYSCHPSLRFLYDLRVFLTIDSEQQLQRLAKRDITKLEAFRERWIPLEEMYFRAYSVDAFCDYVLERS